MDDSRAEVTAAFENKPGAQVVRRRGRVYVINKQNPRFKARQAAGLGR